MHRWRAGRHRFRPASLIVQKGLEATLRAVSLMHLSLTLLLCLIHLKTEQKECDDSFFTFGARHRTPRFVVSGSYKITRVVRPMCAF